MDHAKRAIDLIEKIIGPKSEQNSEIKENYLHAQRLQTLGDVYREMENEEECEKTFLRAQTLIGNMFGHTHPCVMAFNTNLVTCLSKWANFLSPQQISATKLYSAKLPNGTSPYLKHTQNYTKLSPFPSEQIVDICLARSYKYLLPA